MSEPESHTEVPLEMAECGYKDAEGRAPLSNLKHWHSTIVDYLLVNPSATNRQIADYFGMHPVWISRVRNTDAFREYYRTRMQEHRSFISEEIVAKMQGVAVKALDKIYEKMESGDVPMGHLQSAAELSLKALGYWQRPTSGVNVTVSGGSNVQVMSVSAEVLEQARQKLAQRRQENTQSISESSADYQHVTASLEVGVNAADTHDS